MATALRRERTSGSALGDSDAVPKGRDLATTHLLIWQTGTAEQLGSLSIMVACLKVTLTSNAFWPQEGAPHSITGHGPMNNLKSQHHCMLARHHLFPRFSSGNYLNLL